MSSRTLAALALAAFAVLAGAPERAAAQWRPDGALSAQMLIRNGSVRDACPSGTTTGCTVPGLGAGLTLDLFHRVGSFGVGPSVGIYAFGGADDQTRVFVPVTAAFRIGSRPKPIGVVAVARPGFWFGATDAGLRGGLYLSAGAHVSVRVDETISLSAGLELAALFGHRRALLYAPTIALRWRLGDAPDW